MLRRVLLACSLLPLLLFLSACATGVVASASDRATTDPVFMQDYQLGVGDKVRLTVYNEPNISGEYFVNATGMLSLPLIGDVPASGRGTKVLVNDIQTRYREYLVNPNVAMDVVTYRPYYILGEVEKPGQYPYAVGMTVTNAIATAEGYTSRAERAVVYIRRSGSEAEISYKITPDLLVRPGDTIRLGQRYF